MKDIRERFTSEDELDTDGDFRSVFDCIKHSPKGSGNSNRSSITIIKFHVAIFHKQRNKPNSLLFEHNEHSSSEMLT